MYAELVFAHEKGVFHLDVRLDNSVYDPTVWRNTWTPFLASLGVEDPYLQICSDKVPALRDFATRVRDGRCSRSCNPVRAGHVRDEILSVAKAFTKRFLTWLQVPTQTLVPLRHRLHFPPYNQRSTSQFASCREYLAKRTLTLTLAAPHYQIRFSRLSQFSTSTFASFK
jgi:hypothetical protein